MPNNTRIRTKDIIKKANHIIKDTNNKIKLIRANLFNSIMLLSKDILSNKVWLCRDILILSNINNREISNHNFRLSNILSRDLYIHKGDMFNKVYIYLLKRFSDGSTLKC